MKKTMLLLLILCLSSGVLAAPQRTSDPVTYDSYLDEFDNPRTGTLDSGKIWSDKSVVAGDPETEKQLEIDGQTVNYCADFLEIFSALGSVSTLNLNETAPTDTVLLLDVSPSMGTPVGDSTLIERILEAANQTIDTLLQNPQNRVGVVVFAKEAAELIPLDSYERNPEGTYLTLEYLKRPPEPNTPLAYFDLKAQVTTTGGESVENLATTIEGNDGDLGRTSFQQLGLYKAFDALLKSPRQGSRPRLAFLSDGFTNVSSLNWQEPEGETMTFQNGEIKFYSANILTTLLTASYMKSRVNRAYSYPAEVLSFGIDLEDNADKDVTLALIDPGEYFKENGTGYIGEAYEAFMDWLNGKGIIPIPPSLEIPPLELEQNPGTEVSNDEIRQNIAFVDTYAGISAEDLPGSFSTPLTQSSQSSFDLIDDTTENASGDVNTLTYVDPIGEGMKISGIPYCEIGGQLYPVTFDGSAYHIQENGNTPLPEGTDEVKIEVANENGNETLKVHLPQKVLPVVNTTVTVVDGQLQIESSLKEPTSLPFRLFYTLDHTREGELYTNRFTDQDYPVLEASQGDAYVSFIASKQNPFYYVQDDHTVYKNSSEGEGEVRSETNEEGTLLSEPVDDPAEIDPNDSYYIEDTYYRTGTTRSVGESFKYCFCLSGQDLLPAKALSRGTDSPGIRRYGDLSDFVVKKADNPTGTAELRLAPYAPQLSSDGLIISQLGNNGRMIFTNAFPELSLTKKHALSETQTPVSEPLEVSENDVIFYELELKNTGTLPATDVTVTDTLPQGLEIVSYDNLASPSQTPNTVQWQIPYIGSGESVILKVSAKVPPGTDPQDFKNTATYETQGVHDTSNTVVETLKAPQSLVIEKEQSVNGSEPTKDDLTVQRGDTVTYTINVTNNGESAVPAVVCDTVHSGLSVIESSITNGGYLNGDTVVWDLESLDPGVTSLSFEATIEEDVEFPYENVASISDGTTDYVSNTVKLTGPADPAPVTTLSTISTDPPTTQNPVQTTGSSSPGSNSCTSPKTGVTTLAPVYLVVLLAFASLLGLSLLKHDEKESKTSEKPSDLRFFKKRRAHATDEESL